MAKQNQSQKDRYLINYIELDGEEKNITAKKKREAMAYYNMLSESEVSFKAVIDQVNDEVLAQYSMKT